MTQAYEVLVVGAGHAGAQVCSALRQLKFGGSIGLVGEERDPPYERPALSKDYLAGDKSLDRILIRSPKFWQDRAISLLTGRRVVSLDAHERVVTLADGERIFYSKLVWAAGGTPRRLSCAGSEWVGVHYVRTRLDVDRIVAALPKVRNIVVVGGGYVGLEAAAVLNKLGKAVTVVEAQDHVLARVAGEPVSRFYEAEHRAHGVDIRLRASVDHMEGANGHVTAVHLADGTRLPAEMVVVGIGISPCVEPLMAAGAVGDNGVAIDAIGATSLTEVYAIGDCALHQNDFSHGPAIRLESVQNANDMAQTVAGAIAGIERPYRAVPWFWSNQFDIRLQTVGLSAGHDDIVVRGDPSARRFSVIYLRQGRVIAADCINMTRDYVQARQLVVERIAVSGSALLDPQMELKRFASAIPDSP